MQAEWEVKAAYLAGASDVDSASTGRHIQKGIVPHPYTSRTTHLPIKHHFQRRAEHQATMTVPARAVLK